jgi:hypothetical protein
MNVEVYSYSLFTTVLGMLVVFLSLTALSLMMVVLKRIFSADTGAGGRGSEGVIVRREKAARLEQPTAAQQLPEWLPMAVAVYLTLEEEPERPSADPWNAVVNQYDPWISAGRFGKRGV